MDFFAFDTCPSHQTDEELKLKRMSPAIDYFFNPKHVIFNGAELERNTHSDQDLKANDHLNIYVLVAIMVVVSAHGFIFILKRYLSSRNENLRRRVQESQGLRVQVNEELVRKIGPVRQPPIQSYWQGVVQGQTSEPGQEARRRTNLGRTGFQSPLGSTVQGTNRTLQAQGRNRNIERTSGRGLHSIIRGMSTGFHEGLIGKIFACWRAKMVLTSARIGMNQRINQTIQEVGSPLSSNDNSTMRNIIHMQNQIEQEVIPRWQTDLSQMDRSPNSTFFKKVYNDYGPLGALLLARLKPIEFMETFIKTKDHNMFIKNLIYYFYNNLVMPLRDNQSEVLTDLITELFNIEVLQAMPSLKQVQQQLLKAMPGDFTFKQALIYKVVLDVQAEQLLSKSTPKIKVFQQRILPTVRLLYTLLSDEQFKQMCDFLETFGKQAHQDAYFKANRDKTKRFQEFLIEYAVKKSKESYIKYLEKEGLALQSLVGGTTIKDVLLY